MEYTKENDTNLGCNKVLRVQNAYWMLNRATYQALLPIVRMMMAPQGSLPSHPASAPTDI